MRTKRNLSIISIIIIVCIAVLCVIFLKSRKNTNNSDTETVQTTGVAETVSETPTTAQVDDKWDTAKCSGSIEDFEQYFDLDLNAYQTADDNATLGQIVQDSYYSDVVGAEREVYIYLPPDYSEDKTYPVMYMIHGIGCDGSQWVSMSLNIILSNMIESGESEPFIAVLPSVIPKDGVDSETLSAVNIQAFSDFADEFIEDLEPHIFSNYPVSQDRADTAVCGLSMGGMESLALGFTLKDHFNYIGSFSAAPSLDTSILNLDNWSTTPDLVLLCSGNADGTVGDNPKNYHNILTDNDVDHIWYQYPDGGHSPEVWKNGLINFIKQINLLRN